MGSCYLHKDNVASKNLNVGKTDLDFNLSAGEGRRFLGYPSLKPRVKEQSGTPTVNLDFDIGVYEDNLEWLDKRLGLKS